MNDRPEPDEADSSERKVRADIGGKRSKVSALAGLPWPGHCRHLGLHCCRLS